jgi:hypothetical protein
MGETWEDIGARLEALGEAELADVVTFVGRYPDWACRSQLIEACWAVDLAQVMLCNRRLRHAAHPQRR